MKIELLILLTFVALTLCVQKPYKHPSIEYEEEEEEEEEEREHEYEKEHEREDHHFKPCWDCEYPCECDKHPVTETCHVSSPVKKQVIRDNTVLWCADGSYFKRLEFKGCYELNTSCNLIEAGYDGPVENLYTGYRTNDVNEEGVKLRTDNYYNYLSFLNGNLAWFEWARIENWEPCDEKDILVAQSLWAADNPLTGCCDEGVNHLQSTFYQVNLYGPHCSECYLVQAAITYEQHKVRNA